VEESTMIEDKTNVKIMIRLKTIDLTSVSVLA
jgi:hypothetical protein